MSVVTSHDYASPVPEEPFGQRGMRQYAGRIFAWFFFTAALASFAMGHRSSGYTDRVEWRNPGQMLRVTSGGGQLLVEADAGEKLKGDGTWSYRGGYFGRRWADRFNWSTDLGRTFGVEWASQANGRNADSGFLFRVKWWLLSLVLIAQPAVFVTRRLLAWHRRRDDDAQWA